MDKYIFDESNGLWYELQGDYYIPCLILPAEEDQPIGLWGQRHLRYIKKYRQILYTNLQLSGKLDSYLVDVDQQAETLFSQMVEQMAQRQFVGWAHCGWSARCFCTASRQAGDEKMVMGTKPYGVNYGSHTGFYI